MCPFPILLDFKTSRLDLNALMLRAVTTSEASLQNLAGLDEISSGQTLQIGAGLRNDEVEAGKSGTEVEKIGQNF